MSLTAPIFLFGFLPLFLAGFLLLPTAVQPAWLLAANLLQIGWRDPGWVGPVAGALAAHWILARLLAARRGTPAGRLVLGLGLALSLGPLLWLRVAWPASRGYDALAAGLGLAAKAPEVLAGPFGLAVLALGATASLLAIHRGLPAEADPVRHAARLSFFPVLAAGPLPRVTDLASVPGPDRPGAADLARGLERLVGGLAKRMLLAAVLAPVSAQLLALPPPQLTAGLAWTAMALYSLQVWLVLSGTCDMAIGLGRMLGMRLPEDFGYPLASRSLGEFWRRWNTSLQAFVGEHQLGPLGPAALAATAWLWYGGGRLLALWLAAHALLVLLERTLWGKALERAPPLLGIAYVNAVVAALGCLFRTPAGLPGKLLLQALLGLGATGRPPSWQLPEFDLVFRLALGASVLVAAGGIPALAGMVRSRLGSREDSPRAFALVDLMRVAGVLVLYLLGAAAVAASTLYPYLRPEA